MGLMVIVFIFVVIYDLLIAHFLFMLIDDVSCLGVLWSSSISREKQRRASEEGSGE